MCANICLEYYNVIVYLIYAIAVKIHLSGTLCRLKLTWFHFSESLLLTSESLSVVSKAVFMKRFPGWRNNNRMLSGPLVHGLLYTATFMCCFLSFSCICWAAVCRAASLSALQRAVYCKLRPTTLHTATHYVTV